MWFRNELSSLAEVSLYLYWPIHNAVTCSSSTVRRRSRRTLLPTAVQLYRNVTWHCAREMLHKKTGAKLSGTARHRPTATLPHRNWHEWEADEQTFYKRDVCYFAYLISLNKTPLTPLFRLSVLQFHTSAYKRNPFSFLSASTSYEYKLYALRRLETNFHCTKSNNTLFQKN